MHAYGQHATTNALCIQCVRVCVCVFCFDWNGCVCLPTSNAVSECQGARNALHVCLCRVICCLFAAGWIIVGELLTYFLRRKKKERNKRKRTRARARSTHKRVTVVERKENAGVRKKKKIVISTQTNLRSCTQWASTAFVCSIFCSATRFMIDLVSISIRAVRLY